MKNKEVNQNRMEVIVSLAKRRGFVFPGSEIYGGLANSWDFGPLGVLMKQNIKQRWWKRFVEQRPDMVGIETALMMNPKVWQASGHLENFNDPLVECKKCHSRFRLDQLPDGKKACLACGGPITEPKQFNLMFKTFFGPSEDQASTVYFRPETAQGMFVNFKNIIDTTRRRLPFGMAQVGKAFRNEITPGNFIFRTREFEQMEIEYFIKPDAWESSFEHWLVEMRLWLKDLGVAEERIYEHEIPEGERAHYSRRTVDIEYEYPFGRSELYGLAYRTDFDLKNHMEKSGQDLRYSDSETGEKFLPHVIEPTFGVERSFLVALLEAYREESAPTADGESDTRVVLKFPKWLAPIKVAVLPLSKKANLSEKAQEIFRMILSDYSCEYDETQSIGKRYRRQDEIGTPYCVTVDFDTLEDQQTTVRDRDTMKQERIAITELKNYLQERLNS